MAQFFKAKPNRSKQLSAKLQLKVTQLDHLGAGMAQHQGKVVFIPGALPGETVTAQLTEQKKQYARGKLLQIDTPAPSRCAAPCRYYTQCGGCDLQHTDLVTQRQIKSDILVNMLSRACGYDIQLEQPIAGEGWHYRRRARLATWYDKQHKTLTLGFRQEGSKQVIAIDACPVLAEQLSALIAPLSTLLNTLALKTSVGHVELIEVDNGCFVVLRVTQSVSVADKAALAAFAHDRGVTVLLQDNQGQCCDLQGDAVTPAYQVAGFSLAFKPGNFIQVNGDINARMVQQAIDWLAPVAGERVLDLFCGVGNFSLPLAASGAQVIGVEGVPEMVSQASTNASAAGLDNLAFFHGDLSSDLSAEPWLGRVDKLLLDPARAGAFESLQWLKRMKPRKVVYVSCNPSSLSRDCKQLLAQGYRMSRVSLIDMFPQTHHIETMALFEL
ncbi:23S rRNA (uracil(1939)-C(5))-methyltransferase RlmD [Shewanella sp. NFH-SH190041]|uniref:23S rRNA (uracil(1939)-C(5))-methyltransferase RlmD n=1 Tax=Shewanella sp. NFH-SH190041 TaxID=2950245 RepID=UPI0021C4B1A1|nr:23S rRNA (uracil(1939)-C(5))-methyltransferase RlmD [Shewanella sp. NFH-SH190041]BDM65411.1 23S rRNA (uracil(1939)-C(5))-methyltransferase RlmD [Shewanella sp. NFH-SH190041]